MQELYDRIVKDLKSVGIPKDFSLVLKPYSKTLNGKYNPNTQTVTLYTHQDPQGSKIVPYEDLLMTAIHEAVHHIQWCDDSFVRLKGVMHNPSFYELYYKFRDRALALLLLQEVRKCS